MQIDPITLEYDHDHDGGTTPLHELEFTRAEEAPGRSLYVSENHTLSLRDTLAFYRTNPKVNGMFKGVAKTSVKFTFDISVPSTIGESSPVVAPMIVEASFSIPVGATPAQVLEIRQKLVALLNMDTQMDLLNNQLVV